MKFLKTCFECGAKVEKLYDGICEICFKEHYPPIKELKPINLKVCNSCKKVHYNNQLLTIEELYELVPGIVNKRLTLHPQYELKDLKIENFEIDGHKVTFDVEVDCELK